MSTTLLKIEKNVPAPTEGPKYPFAKLKVGESFEVPASIATAAAVRVAASDYAAKNPGVKLRTQQNEAKTATRVWRVKA